MTDSIYPKLRAVQAEWIEHMGEPVLLLQDRQAVGARAVVVPRLLAPLLALFDGTRDLPALRAAFELRVGVRLEMAVIENAVAQLDQALLLDGERYAAACRSALASYRSAPFRPAALAGLSYPADAAELRETLDGFLSEAEADGRPAPSANGRVRGLVSPHIDYERGSGTYARVWGRARQALEEASCFLVLGTDHMGGPGELTLTRQGFQTPFGILPTDTGIVDEVAAAMGEGRAFGSELNHLGEHSIELAALWLHHLVGDRPISIVPVLCGSFHPYTAGHGRPAGDGGWEAAARVLSEVARREGTMVIAAADLAHVGPSFGDPHPYSPAEKRVLRSFDREMLGTMVAGDAESFLDLSIREKDRFRVCGLPPIYLAMRVLGRVKGDVVAYSQCPAPGGSIVSVAGLLWSES